MANKIFTRASDGDWDTAGNWTPANAPTNGDIVFTDGRMMGALTGEDESAVTLAAWHDYMTRAYAIGSPELPLTVGATKLDIGLPGEDGSSGGGAAAYFGTHNIATAVTVHNTASAGAAGLPPVNWKGTNAANIVTVLNGTFGIATADPADTATVAELNVKGGICICANGVALDVVNVTGGTVYINSAVTTLNVYGGTVHVRGTGKITTLNAAGGVVYASNRPASGDNIDSLILNGGTVNFADSETDFSVGETNIRDGGGTIVLAYPTQGTFTGGFVDDFEKSSAINFAPRAG